ncbi:ABC1 kinase family protein [Virgibacillus sp. W0430]|uniref:ABC1 kinase family protein n=1 Tax=Virgibacillus sp. W0430 TaxID=3391580 RepID=UPI003F475351
MLLKKLRHTHRYQEIINVLIKNGFSHFLYRIGLTDRNKFINKTKRQANENMTLQHIGAMVRISLQELGPSFIKLGQIASSRRDLLPLPIVEELEKLQEHAPPIPFRQVKDILEAEFSDTLSNVFPHFNQTPLATASIGQVHTAKLKTGERVAIKIQRPNIKKTMETDLEIILRLAEKMEEKTEWARAYRIKNIVTDFSHSLRKELDYRIEAYHAKKFKKLFSKQSDIYIPKIYQTYSTEKVLTMEFIEGVSVRKVTDLDKEGLDRKTIAKRLADSMLEQVLDEGFFHGDPHAGNIYILPDNVISYLDFGMAGYLDDEMKRHIASLVIQIEKQNTKGIIRTFSKWGLLSEATNTHELSLDIDYFLVTYYDLELREIKIGNAISELLTIAFKHNVAIPSNIAVLAKVILTIEAIIADLDPEFNLMQAIKPYGDKLMKQRLNPKSIAKDNTEEVFDYIETLKEVPYTIQKAARTIQKGTIRFDVNSNDLQTFLRRLDKISNRISFSIILLAFCILIGCLIIGASIIDQSTLLWKIPIIEIGSIATVLVFLFIMYSVFRSG